MADSSSTGGGGGPPPIRRPSAHQHQHQLSQASSSAAPSGYFLSSPRHHPRQLSSSLKVSGTDLQGYFESPRIPQNSSVEDSPTLPESDYLMEGGGTDSDVPTQLRKTSAGDPRLMELTLQHRSSHTTLLKNMNSQSSLAGMPTHRSNRAGERERGVGGDVTPRSSSRAGGGGGSRVPSGNEGPPPTTATGKEKDEEKDKESNREGGGEDKTKENGTTPTANNQNGQQQKDGGAAANGTDTSAAGGQPSAKPSSKTVRDRPSGQRIKFRHTPHLPQYEAERVPAAMMHWSKAPVHGHLPSRSMRAHTVTMVDSTAWVFGGCDERGCWRDVWCFDIETLQWSHPEMRGDMPPPCRAHTATLVDRKIYVFGGGEGPTYYNDLYILDTVSHKWIKPNIPTPHPLPRRAHTAVLYRDTIYIFGGGNGHKALNDVWALDVSVGVDKLRWESVHVPGTKPGARGYHTANLVGEVMVVLGGSDGRECFADVWVLDLEKLLWREVRPDKSYRRLSHSSTQVGSYLFVMGGHDGNKYSHELLLFNLVTLQFEPRQTQGRPPSSRGYHAATLADSRMWVFGGFDGHAVYDDVWILDLAASAYLPQVTSFGIFVE